MLNNKILPLLSIRFHEPILSQERAALILSRTRLVATILMFLMLLWIPIDGFLVPGDHLKNIVLARIASAIFLSGLVFYRQKIVSLSAAFTALTALLAVPMFFFWYANMDLHVLASVTSEDVFVKGSYVNFSILITMLISLFPLTFVEGALFGVGLVFATAFVFLETGRLYGCGILWCEDLWLSASVAAIAVVASMSQLHFMERFVEYASQDRMTGLLKRDYGLPLMETLFLIAKRDNTPLCAVFIDLDDFKKVNDQYGHDAGDGVLSAAAHLLKDVSREQGVCVRWGGEEFIVMMPKMKSSDAKSILNRLSSSGLGLRPDGKKQTASIGISERLDDGVTSVQELIILADQRMYEAKKSGKNAIALKTGLSGFAEPI